MALIEMKKKNKIQKFIHITEIGTIRQTDDCNIAPFFNKCAKKV